MKIVHLSTVPESSVRHSPSIKKKVIFDTGYIPTVTTFAQATFLPGQSVGEHTHPTMYEVFYILSGKAVFRINGEDSEVGVGDSISIEPGEVHAQMNPYSEPVTWLYFGVATD
jgi:quercetin dioxygenase-like cupin family protein